MEILEPDGISLLGPQGALPKDPAKAIPAIFREVLHSRYRFGPRVWRASLTELNEQTQWLGFMIGIETSTRDEFDEAQGWRQNVGPRMAATLGLIHIPSQTVFVQKKSPDLERPGAIFKALTHLLNDSLQRDYPDTAWTFEVLPEPESGHFFAELARYEVINVFKVTLPTPNARAHELLKELQGEAGEAKADHVQITLNAKRGISRASSFFKNCLEVFTGGLARIVVRGKRRGSNSLSTLDSQRSARLREHEVMDITDDMIINVSAGPFIASEVGFLEDLDHKKPTHRGALADGGLEDE